MDDCCFLARPKPVPADRRANSEKSYVAEPLSLTGSTLLIMRAGQKPLRGTGWWIFMRYLWAHWDDDPTTDLPFLLATKRERHKGLGVLLHLTLWKAYVLPSRLYSAQKMDGHWGYRKRPCPLDCVTKPSNTITCQGSSLFGSVSIPQPFCHFKHVTLMLQTHFSNVLHSI